MSQKLIGLLSKVRSLCQDYSIRSPLEEQANKLQIPTHMRALTLKDLHLPSHPSSVGIGVKSIIYRPKGIDVAVRVYHVPQLQTMPLHDHPDMQVITVLIQGQMEATTFTPVDGNHYRKRATQLHEKDVTYIDGKRSPQDNLHSFRAVKSSFFLDLIFPDYNETRLCTYYTVIKRVEGEIYQLKQGGEEANLIDL